MVSMDVSTRECGGQVIVALHGELDLAEAASVAAALAAVAAGEARSSSTWQAWNSSTAAAWQR